MIFSEKLPQDQYEIRREIVFILLSGIFIGTLAMLNILGISRLIDLSFTIFGIKVPFTVFVGVLPYPVTFLCTDIISEFYGKKRAAYVVWTGLILNIWVIFILWIGGILPPEITRDPLTELPSRDNPAFVFFQIRNWTFSATLASMLAYLTAQLVDVHIFHFLKKKALTKLWLRNNGSTMTSQMVDSVAVVLITYFSTNAIHITNNQNVTHFLIILIFSNYLFKFIAALIDTLPFYLSVRFLTRFLGINPLQKE